MSTELAPITELPDLAKDMPELLLTAQAQLTICSGLVKAMTPITDEATKNSAFVLRDKIKLAATTYKEMRMPFTRKLNDIVSLFTGNEKGFDGLVTDIESKANMWATKELAKKRAADEANDKLLKEQQTKIALEGVIREGLRMRINAMLENIRTAAGAIVNAVTKDNLADQKKKLATEPRWVPETMDKFYFKVDPWTNDQDTFKRIADEEFEANKTDYLTKAKTILTDSLAIVDVALTNKAEADRLQAAATEQAKKDTEIQSEEAQRATAAELALANLDINKAELAKGIKPKMKIDIQGNDGWIQIIAFWFQHDPAAKTADLSKKTFLQCKTFAENLCNNTGTILEHEDVIYVEVVKVK